MADIPMRSVLVTDFGEYELPRSVADKINEYPKERYFSPYTEESFEWQGMTHPTLARYYRMVSEHMKRKWLAEG